jgi:hypothetical protein
MVCLTVALALKGSPAGFGGKKSLGLVDSTIRQAMVKNNISN